MIIPINNHVLVEPVVHDSFIASTKETYEEMGIVLSVGNLPTQTLLPGCKVYFDSWLAAKYPTGEPDKYYWLVPYENIRAYEQIPEQQL